MVGGTPEQDDFIKVQDKINVLIENNKQFIIISNFFKKI